MPRFEEVSKEAGVDGDLAPPGMIVCQGGSNLIRLVGGSRHKFTTTVGKLKIELLDPARAKPPTGGHVDARIVQVSDTGGVRRRGMVWATHPLTGKAEAGFEVAVLPKITVKLSIKPVLARNDTGAVALHTHKPFDVRAMVAQMNAIWIPQANVEFTLVPSGPADFTGDEAEIARLRHPLSTPPPTDILPVTVVLPTFRDLFDGKKNPDADLTMFLVQTAGDLDPGASRAKGVSGVSDPHLGIALIGDERMLQPVMAHEAGHFLYGVMPPTYPVHPDDPRMLMHPGGTEAKVPYNETVNHFNPV